MTQKQFGQKIPVGLSECLTGKDVRYNGSNKHSKLCTQQLANYFELVPCCPEMAIGMGVPRKPIRLVDVNGEVRVRGVTNPDVDVTEPLTQIGEQFAHQHSDLCGFIFTQNSPSCGLHGVKVYHENGIPLSKGQGAFAAAITRVAPWLPVEEAGRLNDPLLKETFIAAVYCYQDWLTHVANSTQKKALVDFHARHKYMLMAHSIETYRELGNLLADLKTKPLETAKQQYLEPFMDAIKRPASRGMHTNVLEHIQGYLKRLLDSAQKNALNKSIHDYRLGLVPLIVPITLLKHYSDLFAEQMHYINQQSYLNPHPPELGLRNAI